MPYATQDDLVPRRLSEQSLGQLTDDSGQDQINSDVVTGILTEASASVDSYCSERYAIPLQASEQIKGITLDIAVYLLYSRRDRVTDNVRQRYVDATQFLKDVAAGKAGLDQPAGATQQAASVEVLSTKKPEVFSHCNLEGFN